MKIAYDYQAFTLQSYGGISRYFVRLMDGVRGCGHEVRACVGWHRNHYLSELSAELVDGQQVAAFPPRCDRFMRFLNHLRCGRAIRRFAPDLIHETYYSSQCWHRRNLPRVLTVYDMVHERFPDSFPHRDFTARWKRRACERADHIISISESTKRDLMDFFHIPEEKISVIHLAADPPVAHPAVLPPPPRPFLLFVGLRGGYKNFMNLVAAFAIADQLRADYDLIAFGGGAFNAAEQEQIQALGFAAQQIRQVGGDDRVLSALYRQAAAFVYPSCYEGFGLPPLEAMAHDCPVISSRVSSMPEVIADAGEYFDPDNVADMARALSAVLTVPSRAEDLRVRGRQRFAHFSWQRCAQETLAVYDAVLAGR